MRYRSSPLAVFAAMAVVLVASVSLIYMMGLATLHRTREVVQHQMVLDHIERALTTLIDAETGQRGYLLTGDEQYLQPYRDAVARIHGEIELLRGLAKGGQLNQSDVNKLLELAKHKLTELDHTIDLRRAEGLNAALAIVRSDEGRITMDVGHLLHQRAGQLVGTVDGPIGDRRHGVFEIAEDMVGSGRGAVAQHLLAAAGHRQLRSA